jgi:hypothetical protein
VANVRVHGTLRERPVDRYRRELPFLVPLPTDEFDTMFQVITRKVNPHFCVSVDTNQYSVHPKHVGKKAMIKVFDDHLKVFIDYELVAVHPLQTTRYGRHILPEHEDAFHSHGCSRELLKEAFLKLGPAAEEFYQGLLRERGRGTGFHLSRIVQLAKRHGSAVVSGALRHAHRYGAFSAEAVVRIVHGKTISTTKRIRSADYEGSFPPQNVRTWLESLDVETRDLADYDKIIFNDQHEEN